MWICFSSNFGIKHHQTMKWPSKKDRQTPSEKTMVNWYKLIIVDPYQPLNSAPCSRRFRSTASSGSLHGALSRHGGDGSTVPRRRHGADGAHGGERPGAMWRQCTRRRWGTDSKVDLPYAMLTTFDGIFSWTFFEASCGYSWWRSIGSQRQFDRTQGRTWEGFAEFRWVMIMTHDHFMGYLLGGSTMNYWEDHSRLRNTLWRTLITGHSVSTGESGHTSPVRPDAQTGCHRKGPGGSCRFCGLPTMGNFNWMDLIQTLIGIYGSCSGSYNPILNISHMLFSLNLNIYNRFDSIWS